MNDAKRVRAAEQAVEGIQMLCEVHGQTSWEIGNAVHEFRAAGYWQVYAEVHRGDWQAALRPGRTYPIGSAWEFFCEKELKMSVTHANNLARASQRYTREHFVKFGMTKLVHAMDCPPERRKRLWAMLERGASCKEIKAFVTQREITFIEDWMSPEEREFRRLMKMPASVRNKVLAMVRRALRNEIARAS